MVTRKAIASILEDYEDIVVATVCSHSSLQIFHGARQEGFRTLGIAIGQRPRFYDAFPLARPDEFLIVDSYADILDRADDLIARQAVTVPTARSWNTWARMSLRSCPSRRSEIARSSD